MSIIIVKNFIIYYQSIVLDHPLIFRMFNSSLIWQRWLWDSMLSNISYINIILSFNFLKLSTNSSFMNKNYLEINF